MPPIRVLITEPHGSVYSDPLRCLVRRALGHHPTRRSGAARACRRFHHGPCREVPHDPHGHEEACRRLGEGGARHHGEGRARADLQARPAPTGGRGGMDREVPPALGGTLRRAGQSCRGTENERRKLMDARTESEPTPMQNRTTVERKSERELVLTRTFNGPARLVFEAWTKPELLKRWWAPKSSGMSLLSCV